ncbi:hypothetical protein ORJ66_21010 [Pseudoalteromonas tunicata]|uniref:hypothetical protein n=1 Tax=Pseudoalteromonas tunicata TaxID=314281 RepID=UPI00273E0E98|nr:hypothetical protein [Pseudoalteromonas tunicata]MDP5215528.1 hypothetical protein [Pseudoalteromonas tunicata]
MLAGVFFILIILPAVVSILIYSVYQLIKYFTSRNKNHLQKLAILWCTLLVLFLVLFTYAQINAPVAFTKEHVIGSYQIDTSFYPGKNSEWQKKHFRFEITQNDEIILFERLKDGSELKYVNKIKWNMGPPFKWSILIKEQHHILDSRPTLFRSINNKKFYYVFKSQNFGNMFFRKVKGS